ncbi:MAG: hypothetical protein ACKVS8_11195 [Phycisphaerales bacterium]
MMRSPLALWLVAAVVAGAPLAWFVPASWSARSAAHARLDQLASAEESARRIADLQGSLPEWTRRAPPGSGVAQDVAAVLAASGLPPATLVSLAASGDEGATSVPSGTPAASSELRVLRRRANLALSGLTLPQLGTFLGHFRQRLDVWTVTSVEITPIEAASPSAGGGGDLPLRIQLAAETLSLFKPERPASATPTTPTTSAATGAKPPRRGSNSPLLPGPSPAPPASPITGAKP